MIYSEVYSMYRQTLYYLTVHPTRRQMHSYFHISRKLLKSSSGSDILLVREEVHRSLEMKLKLQHLEMSEEEFTASPVFTNL